MSKEWIAQLAAELKERGREAAESYGRQQHRAGIIDAEGKVFFMALVSTLEQDLGEIRGQLQGSAVSSETSVVRSGADEIKLMRSRFPWFDATLRHDGPDVALDYAKDRGVAPDKALEATTERLVLHFNFEVDRQDRMALVETFGDKPLRFDKPEEFAKHLIELLFTV